MNIYLISQDINHNYDSFDSAVVIALDEDHAKRMHPIWHWRKEKFNFDAYEDPGHDWATSEHLVVELIGTTTAKESRVVCSSFNAG